MKKFILIAGLVFLGFSVSNAKNFIHKTTNQFSISLVGDSTWTKSANWMGMSKGKKLYYKINPKNQVIFASTNLKTWSGVVGGTWITKDGKWVKITEKKLMWSADNGETWSEVPEWTWQDADGNWCKFDAEWNLWKKKGA